MAKDKYLYVRDSVSGFSFANLGLFTGFADAIYNAVYSLVLMEIFRNSAVVGIYVSIYAGFCMLVALLANELLRVFTKSAVFYSAMLALGLGYIMMSFSIQPNTFITLDYTTGIAITLVGVLIPLFMADFSKNIGMTKLNARYHLWLNVGALIAPFVAVAIANHFGNRAAFFAAGAIYLMGLVFFKLFNVVQAIKPMRPVNTKRTLRALWKNTVAFFSKPVFIRAYIINFSYYALRAMRYLYVPILVIENGFSKDVLGWVLALGIIPYLVASGVIDKLIKIFGKRFLLVVGFSSFAMFSVFAIFTTGWPLVCIFVAWQFSGAIMESVHDLLFFDNAKKSEQTRFYGVFRTSVNLPNVLIPILAAGCITLLGSTSAVWITTAFVGTVATAVLMIKE